MRGTGPDESPGRWQARADRGEPVDLGSLPGREPAGPGTCGPRACVPPQPGVIATFGTPGGVKPRICP